MPKPTTNWGNYPQYHGQTSQHYQGQTIPPDAIPRGQGRSYGDASLGSHMHHSFPLNRFRNFDDQTGWLTAESGLTFKDIVETFVPKGWFPAITPGTQYATLGGGVAADVHGKNHHQQGSIGHHLQKISLNIGKGPILHCSPNQHPDLFWATVGGMGLTGMVETATLKLNPIETAYVQTQYLPNQGLTALLSAFEAHHHQPYLVAWIDCLSKGKQTARSILSVGQWATKDQLMPSMQATPFTIKPDKPLSIPFSLPGFTLNPLSIRLFNAAYYGVYRQKKGIKLVDYRSFFYPLDSLLHWNRIYGRRGFVQYQCVIPLAVAHEALDTLLSMVQAEGKGSFLAVLKRLGKGSDGLLSFPMEGYTLTLDMPIYRRLWEFLNRLDEVVLHHGGRIYLAKDARLSPGTFAKMYPRLDEFRQVLATNQLTGRFQSALSQRLSI